ncbi:MAG: hypothetical protein LBG27_05095 [Spirochaetaceae bacterium]|nr:hypothetical protein [Spirochaetaceae bacterium]
MDTSFGTAGLKARKVFRQPRLLPPIRLFCQPSQKAAFNTAGKANRLSNQRASILIRLSGLLTAFAFAVNSLSLCQLSLFQNHDFFTFSPFFRVKIKQTG